MTYFWKYLLAPYAIQVTSAAPTLWVAIWRTFYSSKIASVVKIERDRQLRC